MWLIRWFSRRRVTGATLPDIIHATLHSRAPQYTLDDRTAGYVITSRAPRYTVRYLG